MKLFIGLAFIFSISLVAPLHAQKNVRVSIVITDLHLKYSLKSGTDPRVRFLNKQTNLLLNPTDAEGFNCLHLVDYKLQDAAMEYSLNPIELDLSTGTELAIRMEAFEKNKKKGDCDFNGSGLFNKDKNHAFTDIVIDLKKIQPGIFSPKFTATTEGGLFAVEYKIKYSLPAPDPIKTDEISGKYCADKKILLSTGGSTLPNLEGVMYKWEIQSPESTEWKLLNITDQPQTSLDKAAITKDSITDNLKVPVRVSLQTKEELSVAVITSVVYMPAAPAIPSDGISVSNTCKDAKQGIVWINNIKGVTQNYMLVLRPASAETGICFPDNTALPCKETDLVKATQQNNDQITGLAKGEYKLYLTNKDQNKGACYLWYPVVVNEHPKLEEIKKEIKAVSCNALDDGEIMVSTRGGNPALLKASISPQIGIIEMSNRNILFKKLLAGKYQITITDSCAQTIEISATITEPPPVKIDITNIAKSTCNETPNGSFTVTINQGMGPFRYILLTQEGVPVYKSDKTNMPSWIFNNLQTNDYRVLVYSNGSDSCKPVERKVQIEGLAFNLDLKLLKNIPATCEDCKNGALQFEVTDYKGALQFMLTNTVNNQVVTNTIGFFDNLPPGKYSLALKRADTNCGDTKKIIEIYTILSGGVNIVADTATAKAPVAAIPTVPSTTQLPITESASKQGADTSQNISQTPAEFPGGLAEWNKYLSRNLNINIPVDKGAPSGTYSVEISFAILKDGTISDVVAGNDPGYGTKEEAMRVIYKSPDWKPAVQNGKNVIYRHKQKISFTVN